MRTPQCLLFALCTLALVSLSCGDSDEDISDDLRVVVQPEALRAKLGESVSSTFTLVNASKKSVQFTLESHAPATLLTTTETTGSIAPKSAREIGLTATCPMQDGQFLMRITATNDNPDASPTDIFFRLLCGWVAADPDTIGDLLVIIDGLPQEQNANIHIEGPDQFQAIVDTTTKLRGLPLGRYVLTAEPVLTETETYNPAPLTFTLNVTNDNKARASFLYFPASDFDLDD